MKQFTPEIQGYINDNQLKISFKPLQKDLNALFFCGNILAFNIILVRYTM